MTSLIGRIGTKFSGLVWVSCPHQAPALEAAGATEDGFRVHHGTEPPAGEHPSCVVLCPDGEDGTEEDVASKVRRTQDQATGAPVLVLGPHPPDPRLATAALRAGAGGFVHAGMQPKDLVRAISLVSEGRIVIPRDIVLDLLGEALFLSMPVVLGRRW